MTSQTPILYNFRRCPYAMRARLALLSAGIQVEVREIVLRDKPAQMLELSPKGTVPVLRLADRTIEESDEIMEWALAQSDPENLLSFPAEGREWIKAIEGPFKTALDRYKYASRYENVDASAERDAAAQILHQVNHQLTQSQWLFGDSPSFADLATITFVRQFANVDRDWFETQNWPGVQKWLSHFVESARFNAIMQKYPLWVPSSEPIFFL